MEDFGNLEIFKGREKLNIISLFGKALWAHCLTIFANPSGFRWMKGTSINIGFKRLKVRRGGKTSAGSSFHNLDILVTMVRMKWCVWVI